MHNNMQRTLNLILALFLLVALWLGYWGVARETEMATREDNPRLVEAEQRLQRGCLLDRHGAPLAWSNVDAEGYAERRYAGDWLAHAVGYYSLRHGVGGAEAAFDAMLRGQATPLTWQTWRDELLHRPQVGQDVTLTLDAGLQRAASEALGGQAGAVVLLDAQSGEVLALVSQPTFDANRLDEEWDALREAPGQPLFNRATQGLYPPGETFHLIVMAAALEEKLTAPDEVFYDDYKGRQEVGGVTVPCGNHAGQTEFDLLHAAAYGCNVAFAQLSLRLGGQRLASYAGWFGIGSIPTLEIPGLAGQLAETLPIAQEALPPTGYGQAGVLASPLQMALVAATIAHDGEMPTATLLPGQAARLRGVVGPETAQWVRQAMALAVSEGPAAGAAVPGVTVAGKVGTAESSEDKPPHAWFIGLAPGGPEDTPRLAIAVVVEHGGQGGQAAAPIAGRLLALALAALR